MKTISVTVLFFSITLLKAQNTVNPCAFDQINNKNALLNIEEQFKQTKSGFFDDSTIKRIPVVVHIFHNGGSENISFAQIESQIRILNEDYGKLTGTNGDGNGVDTKVRFFLAQKDPDGNCTNGIVRIKSLLTNHQTYQRADLKKLSFWDNKRYLNMYIVKSINGNVAGYSSFPGGPDEEDGMVIQHNYFGDIGTAATSKGRTTTHEVGHWLGLYHTFNGGCGTDVCSDGDYVCDTPPQAEANFDCITQNTCSNDSPNLNDQKENYMDYTPDNCKNMFTDGQKDRIQNSLNTFRSLIWSAENLSFTGYDSTFTAPTYCGIKANFNTLTKEICVGNSIYFNNLSLNNVKTWNWTFEGGIPATDTAQNPTITYSTLGSFDVQLIVSDDSLSDTLLLENFITVSNPGIGDSLPFAEDFESGVFPPQNIVISNPDGEIAWELDSAAAFSGKYSIRINNLINTNYGTKDEIVLPFFNFNTIDTNHYMSFRWAYARSDAQYSDELSVQLSTDCGTTFKQVFYKSGSGLVTGPTQTTPFIPDSTQWKYAYIDLNKYTNEQYVLLKIINVTDGGNNLYIDDINITGENYNTGTSKMTNNFECLVYPNPANNRLELKGALDSYVLRSLNGVALKSGNFINKNAALEIADLANGLYFVELKNQHGSIIKKVLVLH